MMIKTQIKKKYILTTKYTLILALLCWLLCYSNQPVMGFEIEPILSIDKNEIDICDTSQYSREFILTIDLGQIINPADSLYGAEVWLGYDIGKLEMMQVLTPFSLFNGIESRTKIFEYYYIIENANMGKKLLYGNRVLLRVQGKLKNSYNDIGNAKIFIARMFLGDEFKLSYEKGLMGHNENSSNSVVLNIVNKTMPERQIAVKSDIEEYKINSIDEELKIDYFLEVKNSKNLKKIVCEFKSANANNSGNNDDIEIKSFEKINNSEIFDYQILEHNENKLVLELTLKEETNNININNKEPIGSLILKRNKSAYSEYNVKSNIIDVNVGSCLTANNEQSVLVINEEDENILVDAQKSIECITIGKNLVIKSFDKINKIVIYTVIGNEVLNFVNENNFVNEKIIDLNSMKAGIYFLQINTENKIKNIKLIVN